MLLKLPTPYKAQNKESSGPECQECQGEKPHSRVIKNMCSALPGGPLVKNPPANAGDTGLVPSPRRCHMPWGNQAHARQLWYLGSRAWAQQRSTRATKNK